MACDHIQQEKVRGPKFIIATASMAGLLPQLQPVYVNTDRYAIDLPATVGSFVSMMHVYKHAPLNICTRCLCMEHPFRFTPAPVNPVCIFWRQNLTFRQFLRGSAIFTCVAMQVRGNQGGGDSVPAIVGAAAQGCGRGRHLLLLIVCVSLG